VRILHLTTELTVAGAERIVCTLARAQRDAGHLVEVAGLREGHPSRASVRDTLAATGIPVHSIDLAPSWKLWRLNGLRSLVAASRPDIVHAHLYHANVSTSLLPRTDGRPRLVWTHHDVIENLAETRQHVYRTVWRRPDAHVFVSGAVRDSFVRVMGEAHRHLVIANGIDASQFATDSPSRDRAERRGIRYGFVGRLEAVKGLDLLLHAFRDARVTDPDTELHVAGGGPDRERLERLADDLGVSAAVMWHGHVDDPGAFLADIDVSVIPSRSEGFGLSLLEALATGVPTAAFDLPALREVGGATVAWAKPGDVTALADAMRRAKETGTRDERRACALEYSEARMLDGYASLYETLLAPAS
jgi:glycosyltransferase involved in cell wall biosynthesis